MSDLKLSAALGDDHDIFPPDLAKSLGQYQTDGKLLITINGSGPIPDSKDAIKLAQADLDITNEQFRVHLPDFPEPVHDISEIKGRLANGVMTFNKIVAYYGGDRVFVREAELPVESLPDRLQISRLDAAAFFEMKAPVYSPQIAEIMSLAHRAGYSI